MPRNPKDTEVADYWRQWFMEGPTPDEARLRTLFRFLPAPPRCKYCLAPFSGIGSRVVKAFWGKQPSPNNPGYCNICNELARVYGGGAEVDMAMLFADVRGSTQLSETLSPTEFSESIERFYSLATGVIIGLHGFIDRLGGDAVIAFFGRGLSGPDYIENAIVAGAKILRITGHGDAEGPRIPIGVGVHAGRAFFGSVSGPNGLYNITALGEEVNTGARLAAAANVGELVISDEAISQTKLDFTQSRRKKLKLKGLSEPLPATVVQFGPGRPAILRERVL